MRRPNPYSWPFIFLGWFVIAMQNPIAAAQEAPDDLAHAARLLDAVKDNVFSFDDPAFYWFCRYVAAGKADAALADENKNDPLPWKMLLERPGDFRGKPVCIEGYVQTIQAFDVSNREGIGRLYQCELAEAGTRALCAVICTEEPANLPLRSRVRVQGFFIKVRAFQTNNGEIGAGPLIVAKRVRPVIPSATGIPGGGPGNTVERWMIPSVALLAVIWLLLRRMARKPMVASTFLPADRRNAESMDHDFDWLTNSSFETSEPAPDSGGERK